MIVSNAVQTPSSEIPSSIPLRFFFYIFSETLTLNYSYENYT